MNESKTKNNSSVEPSIITYLHQKGSALGLPVSGTFELTSRCNFNCKMCYIHSENSAEKKEAELSTEEWLKIAKEAKAKGTIFLLLTGGEPLLREDFPYLYEELAKMGFIIHVNTNGSLLTGEIAELFKNYPPFRINVSLYGGSDETYRELCMNEKFHEVVENIKLMKSYGIEVVINCVITPYNSHDIAEIDRLAKELSCHIKTSAYAYPMLRRDEKNIAVNPGRFSPKEAAEKKLEYEKIHYTKDKFLERVNHIKKGIEIRSNECIIPNREISGMKCRAGNSSFWINYKGEMSSCGMIPDTRFSLKSLTFEEAWQGVRTQAKKVKEPKKCQTCKYKHFCNVCAAVCMTETGNFDGEPTYACEMQEHIALLVDKIIEEEG